MCRWNLNIRSPAQHQDTIIYGAQTGSALSRLNEQRHQPALMWKSGELTPLCLSKPIPTI